MFARLLLAPVWVHIALQALLFWTLFGLLQWSEGTRHPWRLTLLVGVAGLAAGVANGMQHARDLRRARGDVPPSLLREAALATSRPPAPADPLVRAEALRLAQFRLFGPGTRRRGLLLVLAPIVLGCFAFLAVDEPRHWSVVATLAVFMGVMLTRDARVKRRLPELAA